MTTTENQALGRRLRAAGLGDFPPSDGKVEVGPAPPGPCDAASMFGDHLVVAADVDPEWVRRRWAERVEHPRPDPSTGLGRMLAELAGRLGRPPMAISVLLAAPYQSVFQHGTVRPGGQADPDWAAYRTDVRCYSYRGAWVAGLFALGRGPGGRWDVYIEVDERTSPGGQASRELLSAARGLVPDHDMLFASTPLHQPRALRAALGSGFLPICTEALYLTRPTG